MHIIPLASILRATALWHVWRVSSHRLCPFLFKRTTNLIVDPPAAANASPLGSPVDPLKELAVEAHQDGNFFRVFRRLSFLGSGDKGFRRALVLWEALRCRHDDGLVSLR